MTNQKSTKQGRYDNKRPKLTWRIPEGRKDDVHEVLERLGLNKQEFVDRLFNLAFAALQDEAGVR